ncbi:MAG: hypothetical protein HY647_04180 [Acidobacteria bacterium]|nr:hypothetical protein [Acidobacteriota bacterium]
MKARGMILLLLFGCLNGIPLRSQRDFLTTQEVDAIRDVQEHDKRSILYLDFAERRLEAVKTELASEKEQRGKSVQANLKEYISILEAVEATIEEGREKRSPLEKALKALQERGSEFLKYLQSLESESTPGFSDYKYTLEEAVLMSEEVIAEAARGPFPEVRERKSAPSQR